MSLRLRRLGICAAVSLVCACASVPSEQLDLVFASSAGSAVRSSLGAEAPAA